MMMGTYGAVYSKFAKKLVAIPELYVHEPFILCFHNDDLVTPCLRFTIIG